MRLKILNENNNHIPILSEAELEKLDSGALDLLRAEDDTIMVRYLYDKIPVVVQSHLLQKAKKRFITDPSVRSALRIAANDYQEDIKNVLDRISSVMFSDDKNGKITFKDIIYEYYNSCLKNKKTHNDNDDEQIKLSLYSFCRYGYKLFMVESAVAAAITIFTLLQEPISIAKKNPINFENIKHINSNYMAKHNNEQFLDLSKPMDVPVLNLTGYAMWVRSIDNVEDITPQDDPRLGHKGIKDAYANCNEVLSLPHYSDDIIEIDTNVFNKLMSYEFNREKSDQYGHKRIR